MNKTFYNAMFEKALGSVTYQVISKGVQENMTCRIFLLLEKNKRQ